MSLVLKEEGLYAASLPFILCLYWTLSGAQSVYSIASTENRDAWDGRKTAPYRVPKKAFSGALGRGVLRFSARAYRNSVHILPKIAYFSQNVPF